MGSNDLLLDAFGRIRELVHDVVEGLTPEQLGLRIDSEANSIAWLVWHLTRIQDDHIAKAAQLEQVWTAEDWVTRFGLPFNPAETGYGQHSDEVAAVQVPSGELLTGYHDAAHAQTARFVEGLTEADLGRVVDKRWDPPVTLAVRLVSVVTDDLEHVGQAAFIRGVAERR